ncbi:MAG: hypothetical protein IKA34_08985 [Bacteroidales bacterium]|nr:hypothetical protein [Bacteroidales bacterium]
MKKYLIILLAAVSFAVSCNSTKEVEEAPLPMFWTWLEDLPGVDMEATFAAMHEAGIDGVMLHAVTEEDYKRDIEIAKKYGITVYAWLWTLNPPRQDRPRMLEEQPELFDVNRNGQSLADYKAYVSSYKFMCPVLPEVKENLVQRTKWLCEIDGIDGVCLDYCRLVDVVLPISLSYNYNITQDGEVFPQWDFGYHPAMLEEFQKEFGYDPREQEDPSRDAKWQQFRCDKITECANLMAETIRSYGKVVTASPFATPKVASFMVAQDWGKWDLDIVFPMLYTAFYTQEAGFAYDGTIENNRDKNPETILGVGLDTELGDNPELIFKKMDNAFKAGAQAVSLYTIAGLNTPELRARFKAYADSLRTVRAENGGKVPYEKVETVDMNPFNHTDIIANVERSMQRLAAGEPIHEFSVNGMVPDDPSKVYPALDLSEYELVKDGDRVKKYRVTDKASNKTFDVIFIVYGEVISGWDVRLAE